MSLLTGSDNFKVKKKSGELAHPHSSDEYEESDTEPPPEVFQVRKIVEHKIFKKDEAYKLQQHLNHTFHVHDMERSHFLCAFRVRWRDYGEKDDTWEPIENFTTAMAKKLKKYCRKRKVDLPKEFEEWLIPANSGSEAGTSGSDHSDGEGSKKNGSDRGGSKQPASLPATPIKRPHIDEKKEAERNRLMRLREDLALSPTPSPKAKNGKRKPFDPLFDYSDDELEGMAKKNAPKTKSPLVQRKKSTPMREKKKNDLDESIDSGEKQRRKEEKKLKKERKHSYSEDNDSRKEEGEKTKKKKKELTDLQMRELAELTKKNSADHIKSLREEDDDKKKEKKQHAKEDQEKEEKPAESAKPKNNSLHDTGHRVKERKLSTSRDPGRWSPIADREPPAAPSTPKLLSHYDIQQKKKRKRIEQRKKEMKKAGLDLKSEEKRGGEERDHHRKEGKKKEGNGIAVPNLAAFRIPKKKEDGEEVVRKPTADSPASPPTSTSSPSSPSEGAAEAADRVARAQRRLAVLTERMVEFDEAAGLQEMRRVSEWGEEEERWRKRMYESGRWRRMKAIRDMPFDIRAERSNTDVRCVRTLRRSLSTERLPHSYRRLSSIRSMDTLASEADSLAAALMEMRIGEQALRAQRRRDLHESVEETRKEEESGGGPESDDAQDIEGKIELFTREMLAMTNELVPEGVMTEEMIRELAVETAGIFISLDFTEITSIFQELKLSECINRTILSLVRIFTPIVNLVEASDGCKVACDEGDHRKCRMLITLLMALSEPYRMGESEEDECAMPPRTLYDAIDVSARCQLRALIRGGCTFDAYYDEEGKNAAHKMMEQCSLLNLIWLIERGLDVNSTIMPMKESDLEKDTYDKPWKVVKESHEKMAFVSQIHSQRLTARSLYWTKGVMNFNLRPLTLVHTITPHAYFHRFTAVTLCDSERKGFDRDDAVILAVHSATVRQGRGLRVTARKTKKTVPELRVPYFLVDHTKDDESFEFRETYRCDMAKLTIHNFERPSAPVSVELKKVGENGATAVFKVPREHAPMLLSDRRCTETLIRVASPPEHSVLLAQYFIMPFKQATGKFTD